MVAEAEKLVEHAKSNIVDIPVKLDAAKTTSKDPNASPERRLPPRRPSRSSRRKLKRRKRISRLPEQEHSRLVALATPARRSAGSAGGAGVCHAPQDR